MDLGSILTQIDPKFGLELKTADAWIRCPLHGDGNEEVPSLRIHLQATPAYQAGDWFCFGCKKWGHFADLTPSIGLKGFRGAHKLKYGNTFMMKGSNRVPLPDLKQMTPWPKEVEWRTIAGSAVKKMEGQVAWYCGEPFLYLPVRIHEEYIGGIYARMDRADKQQKAYFNVSGDWSHSALLNYDRASQQTGPLWIVEGPRDTARMIQLGQRVVGLIGAAYTKEKHRLLTDCEIDQVLIGTDPDSAGELAYETIKKYMSSTVECIRIAFPPGKDPVYLDKKKVAKILRAI